MLEVEPCLLAGGHLAAEPLRAAGRTGRQVPASLSSPWNLPATTPTPEPAAPPAAPRGKVPLLSCPRADVPSRSSVIDLDGVAIRLTSGVVAVFDTHECRRQPIISLTRGKQVTHSQVKGGRHVRHFPHHVDPHRRAPQGALRRTNGEGSSRVSHSGESWGSAIPAVFSAPPDLLGVSWATGHTVAPVTRGSGVIARCPNCASNTLLLGRALAWVEPEQ